MKRNIILIIYLLGAVLSASAQTVLGCDTVMRGEKMYVTKVVQKFVDGRKLVIDSLFIDGRYSGGTRTNWLTYEGKPMPKFTVKTEDGRTITSESLRGKTIVLSFWISTCAPCLKELRRAGPEIIDVQPKDKFEFLAIGSGESAESAKKFRERAQATFPLCYDESGQVVESFADQGFPKIFLIDRQGIVRLAEQGYSDAKFDALKQKINNLINYE